MAINAVNFTPGDLVPKNFGSNLTRHDFPDDFIFGAATSAYQVEGAYDQARRSLTNWDAWSLFKPNKISDGGNGCVAIDNYNRIKEDVAIMKKLGMDHYRFSIAWSRILPGGRLNAGINTEGVRFYNELINLLLEAGIQPMATIFHFDVPQCLEDEYGGFLDRRILQDFAEYAQVCFFEFGDRVKLWITINEAVTFAINGYVTGSFPPGHGSPDPELGSTNFVRPRHVRGVDHTIYGNGDPARDPYTVAHHLILAHAFAVDVYRTKFQAVQGGKIGMTNMTTWFDAYNPELPQDVEAAKRAVDFMWGWFVEPIVTGHYPETMQTHVGDRLPKFTPLEEILVTQSFDFLGMNYYTSYWAANKPKQPGDPTNYMTDMEVEYHTERDGIPIGPQAGSDWLFIVPVGIYQLLTYTQEKYGDPIIIITENGVDEKNRTKLPIAPLLEDDYRIKYHQDHLAFVKLAMHEKKVRVKGYTVWSIFDNFEMAAGYTVRFGMFFIDYANGLNRYPKDSAIWYMNFLNKNIIPGPKSRQIEEVKEDKAAIKRK